MKINLYRELGFLYGDIRWIFQKRILWPTQRLFRGYSDDDIWNLNVHLAKLINKRLKAFRKKSKTETPYPAKNHEEWISDLNTMISAFDFIILDDSCFDVLSIEECQVRRKHVQSGLKLFAKYFEYLFG